MFASIPTFDFDIDLGSFFTFWGPNGLFWGLWYGSKTVFAFNHIVEQLLFTMIPSFITFEFD